MENNPESEHPDQEEKSSKEPANQLEISKQSSMDEFWLTLNSSVLQNPEYLKKTKQDESEETSFQKVT